jgi:hypothetical protein
MSEQENQIMNQLMNKYVNWTLTVSAGAFAYATATLLGLFIIVIDPFTAYDHSMFFLYGMISTVVFVASLADIIRGLTVVMVVEKLLTRGEDSV